MTTKRTKRIPKLENCNGSGRVYLCGRYHYIGSYGAPETSPSHLIIGTVNIDYYNLAVYWSARK